MLKYCQICKQAKKKPNPVSKLGGLFKKRLNCKKKFKKCNTVLYWHHRNVLCTTLALLIGEELFEDRKQEFIIEMCLEC